MTKIAFFKEAFKNFSDNYVIIGGTACALLFDEVEQDFRATKDIDLVVIAENVSADFGRQMWRFVSSGGYRNKNKSSGQPQFYRFDNPKDDRYPKMIEIFSRSTKNFELEEGQRCVPLPFGEEISSLSALVLDEAYYKILKSGSKIIDGVSVLDVPGLIAFKAKAYLNMREEFERGGNISERSIRKHGEDVLRLSDLLSLRMRLLVDELVFEDIVRFCLLTRSEAGLHKALVGNQDIESVLQRIQTTYFV